MLLRLKRKKTRLIAVELELSERRCLEFYLAKLGYTGTALYSNNERFRAALRRERNELRESLKLHST